MNQQQWRLEETECTSLLLEPTQLPPGWQIVKAAEACEHVTDGTHDSPKATSAGFPLVTSQHIRDGLVDFKNTYKISKEDYEKANKRSCVDQYDVLFSMIGSIGAIAFVEDIPEFAIKNVGLFKTNKNYDLGIWLYYFFQTENLQNYIKSRISGTSQKYIHLWLLRDLPVLLPPLPEQRAIAHTLRTIQKAKEARQRELELEQERKAALMQYLFTHGTRNEPSKKTKIGEIPQSWRIVMLGDLCLNGLGIIQTSPFGSQLHASDYKSAGIPVVNPTHLRFNSIVDDAIPRISREKADSLYKHYLMEGDILISRRGDFSRYSYISQKYSDWFCGTGCLLIRLTHPEVDNYFLSILFSTEVIQNYLKLNAVGSIMPNLNTRILQDVPLTLPKIEQQREIAEVLRSCDRKITALEQEAVFLDELFRAMLEELMTGRLSALPLVEEKALN